MVGAVLGLKLGAKLGSKLDSMLGLELIDGDMLIDGAADGRQSRQTSGHDSRTVSVSPSGM